VAQGAVRAERTIIHPAGRYPSIAGARSWSSLETCLFSTRELHASARGSPVQGRAGTRAMRAFRGAHLPHPDTSNMPGISIMPAGWEGEGRTRNLMWGEITGCGRIGKGRFSGWWRGRGVGVKASVVNDREGPSANENPYTLEATAELQSRRREQ